MVFFESIFTVSGCKEQLHTLILKHGRPVVVSASLNMVWAGVPDMQDGALQAVYVLGPVFTVSMTDPMLAQHFLRLGFSNKLISQLIDQLKRVKMLSCESLAGFAHALYFCVYGRKQEAQILNAAPLDTPETEKYFDSWLNNETHSNHCFEETLFKMVEDGDPRYIELLSQGIEGRVGEMSIGDPLRQAKNEGVALATLASRAAIRGGLPLEEAFTLSDLYIQSFEYCIDVAGVQGFMLKMLTDYVGRVQQLKNKENAARSNVIQELCHFIAAHLEEEIDVDALAARFGYTTYYLTSKFKKETGQAINQYIKEQRLRRAMLLLQYSHRSIVDIYVSLQFSSQSFFTSAFKAYTGVTPKQYREKNT